MDVTLPAGRYFFETSITPDTELERLNGEYLEARARTWKAKEAVRKMERAKNPEPTWSQTKKAWVSDGSSEGFVIEAMKRVELSRAEEQQNAADERRPKRDELSREAGPWPVVGPAVWVGRKGVLSIKRSRPFGLGSQYCTLGTWSAEPMDPVETFWTMPP
uniref:Uncharacterized protein n=1 Tax=Haptolina ericina TaxID=156174 RepID=A0A7S3B6X4_9EUKA